VIELGEFKPSPAVYGLGMPPHGALTDSALSQSTPAGPQLRPMQVALALADQIAVVERRALSDRRIAAVLTDPSDRILAWALNSGATNKTLHAEVNLVQAYCFHSRAPLPRGAKVYTTLKSCRMCAGMIWSAAEDPLSLRVFFAKDDPGPLARQTVLNAPSLKERIEFGPDPE
jgi:tRNA(Arg) A34 adenosine deaminase TadA